MMIEQNYQEAANRFQDVIDKREAANRFQDVIDKREAVLNGDGKVKKISTLRKQYLKAINLTLALRKLGKHGEADDVLKKSNQYRL